VGNGRAEGLWAPRTRALTTGLVLTITFVASEALAVVTVMPVAARDLGGLRLYGWVFSGFMLGNVVGIVAAGQQADRRGPAVPFVAGLALFASGLAVAGLAPTMGALLAGRVCQGMGAGGITAAAYPSIGRSLPGPLQARMMAVLSTAWVAPGLAGPALSAEVAHLFGWRWVFLGLLPVVAVAGTIGMVTETATMAAGAIAASDVTLRPGAIIIGVFAGIATAWVGGWSMYALRRLNGVWAARALPAMETGSRRAVVGLQLRGLTADLLRGAVLTAMALLVWTPVAANVLAHWTVDRAASHSVLAAIAAAVALSSGTAAPTTTWATPTSLLSASSA